jgi:hypothetical protein
MPFADAGGGVAAFSSKLTDGEAILSDHWATPKADDA